MAEDSLEVKKISVNPGSKQQKMRDGWWGGKPFPMTTNGIPKGLCLVLEEKVVNTHGMTADQMRKSLSSHPDFNCI